MEILKKLAKTAAAVIVGAGLMFLLMRYGSFESGIPYTYVNPGIIVLAVFAAVLGPIPGFLIGFIGHFFVDLSWGDVWWSWVLSSAFFGLAIGSFRKFYRINEGKFGFNEAGLFTLIQATVNVLAYVFVARVLDMILFNEAFTKITIQGMAAAILNTAVILVFGSLALFGYSKFLKKYILPENRADANVSTIDIKDLAKLVAARMVFGLFLISAVIIFFVSEMVNFQMVNYENTVKEMTENHLRASVQTLSRLIPAEELDLFRTVEDKERPEFQRAREQLKEFGEEYNVLFAYYWRDYGNGMIQYIIDNDSDPETQVGPGDFEPLEEQAALNALAGMVDVTDLGAYTLEWEGLLTAYAPVFDSLGNVYAVAGVDIQDDFILIQRQDAHNMKLLQLIAIPLAVILAVINMLLYRRKTREIEAAHIKLQYFNNNLRRAFSTYLSEDVVEEIVSDPSRLQLGGIKRHMTVLFTDVKDFSNIAEALAPEQLVDLLNYYLSTMSDVILEQKGTIDKYQGDAIVSFFGAPLEVSDHALRACVSAIIMKRLEAEVNNYVADKKISPMPLLTRIGINSGDMVVGNMGTQKKMNYTIIANAVNLASRLEGLNKQYGTWVLASEATILETAGKLLTRQLDRVRVVGINEPVRIYEVLEVKSDASPELVETVERFHAALDIFKTHNWNEAEAAFNRVLEINPNDGPSKVYIKRCRQFRDAPPLENWDGVFNFSEK